MPTYRDVTPRSESNALLLFSRPPLPPLTFVSLVEEPAPFAYNTQQSIFYYLSQLYGRKEREKNASSLLLPGAPAAAAPARLGPGAAEDPGRRRRGQHRA